jgi:3-phenylpropionate/trans-cinnamate dioxygenase ferredoxin reductase component
MHPAPPESFSTQRIVIIGGGQAAAQASESLRKRGHTGSLTIIGDEGLLPYQRPPLSKKFLAGTFERDRLPFRHAAHYAEHAIDLRLGFAAVSIDRARRRVEIADGSHVEYDALLIATGTRPRVLPSPGAELAGVYSLRNVADVERLRPEVRAGRRAVIVGGGYIGLEVAATCRELGVEVTVLEAADRLMARIAAPEVSAFYAAEHARHGVDVRCGVRLHSLIGADAAPGTPEAHAVAVGKQRVAAVRLADGTDVPADFVLVSIGVEPVDALAREAGLECDGGIVVDEYCRTSDPRIWAAGDVARHPSPHYGVRVRLESVDNAFEHANSAALNMLGLTTVHDKVPWFWSDQYDLKLVIVGLNTGYDDVVLRGDPATRAFSVCYLRGGELIAVETVNHAKDQMAARKLIPARARPDRAKLADPAVPLKDTV